MAEGLMDMFVSHRTSFNDCVYFKKYKDGSNHNGLMYETDPSGSFMAEEVNAYTTDAQQVGSLRTQSIVVTLRTLDDVSGLEIEDLVLYDDNKWRVTSVQNSKIVKENQFMKEVRYEYYISLRR